MLFIEERYLLIDWRQVQNRESNKGVEIITGEEIYSEDEA